MRVRVNTTLDEELFIKTKSYAKEIGLEGANAIIEKALELYFSSNKNSVWEKSLCSGWIKKVVVNEDTVLFENIKKRKFIRIINKEEYSIETMQKRGWKRV